MNAERDYRLPTGAGTGGGLPAEPVAPDLVGRRCWSRVKAATALLVALSLFPACNAPRKRLPDAFTVEVDGPTNSGVDEPRPEIPDGSTGDGVPPVDREAGSEDARAGRETVVDVSVPMADGPRMSDSPLPSQPDARVDVVAADALPDAAVTAVCMPGTKVCNGMFLRTCTTNGSGYTEETCPNGCNAGACLTKRGLGRACGAATDCESGNCVEGVCCNTACADRCHSCLTANTGKADGQCNPVTAGNDPRNHCEPADRSTCGLDGMCDGAGSCRRYPAGTVCRIQSCVDNPGGSSHVPEGRCTQNGACTMAAQESCGRYLCNNDRCRTSCSSSGSCAAGSYCEGTSCQAKKVNGTVCSRTEECASSVCGGRCCASLCACTQPNPGNLVQNSGFDLNLTGWTILRGNVTFEGNQDAETCPYSGSVRMAGVDNPAIRQCVVVNGQAYNVGMRFRITGRESNTGDSFWACGISWSPSEGCQGGGQHSMVTFEDRRDGWVQVEEVAPSPVGYKSVFIDCSFLSTSPVHVGYMDMVYVSPIPAKY